MNQAPFISGTQLACICPALLKDRASAIAQLMSTVLPKYGLDDRDVFHEFVANLAVESEQFLKRSENLNYSVEGLLKTFKKYFNKSLATQYAHQPAKIANRVYADRMGNGPEGSGEGWTYRAGGFIGVTGKQMWEAYAAYKKMTLEKAIEWVRNTDEGALDSACWFFAVYKKLIRLAQDDMMVEIIHRINGGENGMKDRLIFLERAKKCMPL